jgi:hypothetical protein
VVARETGRRTLCGECGSAIDEPSDLRVGERRPCPSCGSLARRFEVKLAGSVEVRSSVGLKARHAGQRRAFLEHFSGADFSSRLRRWMDKVRRIDRENDRYEEVVADPQTSDIIHETHEPLSRHRGHGSARPQPAFSRLPELYALLDDVAAKAQAARPRTSEGLTDSQTLALGLFVATFEVFLGMRALLRERLAEEARMLSRTLLDDTARLVWLAQVRDDPGELEARALRFVFDSLEYEGPLMRAARDNGYEWADEELRRIAEELEVVKAEAKSKGIALKRMPKPIDLLRSLGQEDLYYWHVRASQSIHSSRIGFSARFRPGSDPDAPILITLESPTDEVARVGVMAVQAFSLAMIAAADVLGWGSRPELVEYRDRVVRLSSDLFADIAGKGGAS